MSKIDIFIALLINFIWGSSFAFAGYAMSFYTPVFLYSLRFLITGLATTPFNNFPKAAIKKIFLISIFESIMLYGIALVIKNVDSSTSAILSRLDIIFTIILGFVFLNEKINIRIIFGVLLSFFGAYILSGGIQANNLKYIILLIFCCIFSAIANILTKTIKGVDNRGIVSWMSLFIGIELLVVSLLTEHTLIIKTLNLKAILLTLYLGIVPCYFAYLGLYRLLRKYDTTKVMPYNFIRPVLAIFAGFILLNETITIYKILSCTLIILGIVISQSGKK
ncbi:MAG: DMT family transporter [Rickettsiales bacterium]|nr:DMT family transporter [Rickettsiales bacterium]